MLAADQAGINAGVFDDLHRILLAQLNAANEIDWSRAVIDGSHIDTKKGVPDLESAPISSPHVSGVEDHARDVDEADPRPDEEPAVRGRLRYPETRRGSKLHVLCEAQGIPLAVAVSGANTQDSLALKPLKLKLDGTAAAAETVRRKRRTLVNAANYAVDLGEHRRGSMPVSTRPRWPSAPATVSRYC